MKRTVKAFWHGNKAADLFRDWVGCRTETIYAVRRRGDIHGNVCVELKITYDDGTKQSSKQPRTKRRKKGR